MPPSPSSVETGLAAVPAGLVLVRNAGVLDNASRDAGVLDNASRDAGVPGLGLTLKCTHSACSSEQLGLGVGRCRGGIFGQKDFTATVGTDN